MFISKSYFHTIIIWWQKLSIGGTTEKIVSAFYLVLSEKANEDAEMRECKSAVQHVRKIEKDVDIACTIGKHTTEQR
jgi:regulator of Ty1 transposition protein 103